MRDRDWAQEEYEFWKEHGRPDSPYYLKCTNCEECWEAAEDLLTVDHDARRHAGYHGGVEEEHAEVIVTDAYGCELFRVHAIFKPEMEPETVTCAVCDSERDSGRQSCSNCGHIPAEVRL